MKAMPITSQYGMGSATGGGMVVMSNSPLFSLRRRALYMLADAWGLEYSKDAPATEMRQMLMAKGIDGTKEPPKPYEPKPAADMTITETIPYEEWKFLDLRRECKRLDISFVRTDNKATLLEKLAPPEVIHGQVAT